MNQALSRRMLALAVAAGSVLVCEPASAQTPPPQRSQTWDTVSAVSVGVGLGSQLLMPRLYYAESETTIGWKPRWHVSVLAPLMTAVAATLLTEYAIKPSIEGRRPGCDDTNQGGPGCSTYGAPSTHSMAAFSAFGHGTGVFLVDTLKWNDGRFHAGAFVGDMVVPLLAAVLAAVGRVASNPDYESGGQVMAGAGVGLGVGLLSGIAYSVLQRPECGYAGGMVCW